jgi:hypothetical protein
MVERDGIFNRVRVVEGNRVIDSIRVVERDSELDKRERLQHFEIAQCLRGQCIEIDQHLGQLSLNLDILLDAVE